MKRESIFVLTILFVVASVWIGLEKKRLFNIEDEIEFFGTNLDAQVEIGQGLESSEKRKFNKLLEWFALQVEEAEKKLKKIAGKTIKLFVKPFKEKIKEEQRAIRENPYKEVDATVRVGGGPISSGEEEFLKRKRKISRQAIEKIVGFKIPLDVPIGNICLSLSGGGDRAALYSWGILRGLEKIGLLEIFTHVSTLSGSGWCVWPWLASGKTLEEFKEDLFSAVQNGPKLRSVNDIGRIAKLILRKLAYDQPTNLATFYGASLSAIFLYGQGENNDSQQVYMDSVQKTITDAKVPYPIITLLSVPDLRWFTVTPHELGCPAIDLFIPEWAAGRKFFGQLSVEEPPYPARMPISQWMSASSLAIGASLGDFFENIVVEMKEGTVKTFLRFLLKESPLERLRFIYAEMFNPFFGMDNLPVRNISRNEMLGEANKLQFTDPGVIYGNPVVPFLERQKVNFPPSLIIIADASSERGKVQLEKIKEYANGNNSDNLKYSFPDLPREDILQSNSVTFFGNEKVMVAYFPMVMDHKLLAEHKGKSKFNNLVKTLNYDLEKRIKTGGEYETFNLKYSKNEIDELVALPLFNVQANEKKIRNMIYNYVKMCIEMARPQPVKKEEVDLLVESID